MNQNIYHIPALLPEALDGLNIQSGGVYADATFGGGGHSRGILERLGNDGHLFGFDQDKDAMVNVPDDSRFTFVLSNFRYMINFLHFYGIDKADGVLADLGVSFHHFDCGERGFSFREDAPLDMRMNRQSTLTAKDIVNGYEPERLRGILMAYGDMKRAEPVVRAMLKARETGGIQTTGELADAVRPTLNPKQAKKDLARIFQALRIEVNGEMESLRRFLEALPTILNPGGRAVVITYHSLEDRMVKNFFRTGNINGDVDKDFYGNVISPFRLVTRQPVRPDEEEVERNPRSRSAKMRVAELKAEKAK